LSRCHLPVVSPAHATPPRFETAQTIRRDQIEDPRSRHEAPTWRRLRVSRPAEDAESPLADGSNTKSSQASTADP
jgi:hypothetical protein